MPRLRWPELGLCIVLTLMLVGASKCSKAIKVDPSMHSVLANDLTALVDGHQLLGCGTQLQSGLLFCRLSERTPTSKKITFAGPKSNCSREACVFIKIFFPDGNPALERAIPKDKTEISFLWSELTHEDEFSLDDRGFWGFTRTIYWKNGDGLEGKTIDEGLIYLRILPNEYDSLHESKDSEWFSFKGTTNGASWKVTTSGRTYVSKLAQANPEQPGGISQP